jgi:sortase A
MSKEEMQRRTKGVLLIPKIDVKMLIMDGVDDDTLRVAAGRLPYTDDLDEVGNCVLAGHRSFTFGKYLNRLNELEIGDKITVQTKEKTLNYTIYKKFIIEPDDFSIIEKNDTDKILTVFTCDPPGIGSHRLVVQATQDE